LNGNFSYYKNFGKLPLSVQFRYNPTYGRYVNFINNIENVTNSWKHDITPGFELDFGIVGLEFDYTYQINRSTASVFKQFENNNVTQSWNLELYYENPKIIDFELELEQNFRPTNAVFQQSSTNFIVSANVKRHIDKNENLN